MSWSRIIFCLILLAISILLVVLWVITMVKYSQTPISEIPTWAFIFLKGGN